VGISRLGSLVPNGGFPGGVFTGGSSGELGMYLEPASTGDMESLAGETGVRKDGSELTEDPWRASRRDKDGYAPG
jgi:hypothetical protein